MFYMVLICGITSKKKTQTAAHSKAKAMDVLTAPTTFKTLPTDNKCFYGSVEGMISAMSDVAGSYGSKVNFDQDVDLKELKDFIQTVSELEGHALKGSLTEDAFKTYSASLKPIINKYPSLDAFKGIDDLFLAGKEKQAEDINNLFEALKDVSDQVGKAQPRPLYFAEDFYSYIQYTREQIKWNIMYTRKNVCYPTDKSTSIYSFDELVKYFNCNSFVYTKPGDKFTIKDEDINKGGIAIAFWAKLSIEDIKAGHTTLFEIIKGSNIWKLTQEKGSDGKSISMSLKIGENTHKINNEARCSDMTFNIIVIQKDAEFYKIHYVTKSFVLNTRMVLSLSVPPSFVENATVQFSSPMVLHSNILFVSSFCYNPAEEEESMRKELQIVSKMTDEAWEKILEEIITVCDNPIPDCEYANDDGTCGNCDDDTYNNDGECVPDCPFDTFTEGAEDDNFCMPCSEECLTCSEFDVCTSCEEGLFLYDEECLTECPNDTFPNDKTNENGTPFKECLPCEDDCAFCITKDTCKECKTKYLHEGKCVDPCPDSFFSKSSPNECKECSKNCDLCSVLDKCDKCSEDHFIKPDNTCCDHCPVTFFPNKETGKCEKCGDNCDVCDDKENCKDCTEGWNLHEGKCLSDCPKGFTNVDGVCVKCKDKDCDFCLNTNLSECTKCDDTTFLHEGDCVSPCPEGHYNDENRECQNCLEECEICNDGTSCVKCLEPFLNFKNKECLESCPHGYVAKDGTCIACDKTCKTCESDDTSNCNTCYDTTLLYKDKCIHPCPLNTFVKGKECIDCQESCATCTNPNTCVTCPEDEYLKDGLCVEDCGEGFTVVGDHCEECNKTDCLKCDDNIDVCEECQPPKLLHNGECLPKCPSGFFPMEGECEPCSLHCNVCDDATTCTECEPPKVLTPTDDCANECPTGYTADENNECKKCTEDSCHRCNLENGKCTECPVEEYLYKGKCVKPCPEGTVPNEEKKTCVDCSAPCENCIEKPDKCTSCIDEFALFENECKNDCPSNHANVDKVCTPCEQETCDTCCSKKLETCKTCIEGNYLFEKRCYEECPDGFYEESNGHCEECLDHCKECKNPQTCEECDEEFLLKEDSLCTKNCGKNYVADHENKVCKRCGDYCLTCEVADTDNCTTCIDGRFLFDKKCLENCPDGHYPDDEGVCQKCEVEGCSSCKNPGKICDICIKPQLLHVDNTCIDKCPNGFRKNGNKCEPCSVDECKKCEESKDVCEECKEESLLRVSENKCYHDCPIKTFPHPESKKCKECGEHCDTCTNKEVCTACDGEHVLRKDDKCHNDCPCGQVSNDKGVCKDCGENCKSCHSDDQESCTECKKGFFLDENNKCVEDCGDEFFEKVENRTCEPCSSNCKVCSSGKKCTECISPKVLHEDKCHDDCPDFFVDIEGKCTKCETSTMCLKCKENLTDCTDCGENILFEERCFEECPDGYFLRDNNTCGKCNENCEICSNGNSCETCMEGFYKKDGKCLSDCGCNYVGTTRECYPCADGNCADCHVNKECYKCKKGFVLFTDNGENKCLEECPDEYYSDGHECKPCHDENCLKCKNGTTCDKCETPFSLFYKVECKDDCGDGYVSIDGVCKECENKCKECSTADKETCLVCTPPAVLFEDDCKEKCPPGYVEKESDPGVCTKCQSDCTSCCPTTENCKKCDSGFVIAPDHVTCVKECPSGYVEQEGKCVECTVENCCKCNSTEKKCQKCKGDLFLDQEDDECHEKCPDGEFGKDKECQTCPNCPDCKDETGECKNCFEGFFLWEGECRQDCTDGQVKVEGDCLDCTVEKCKICPGSDTGKCTECLPPNKLYKNECLEECPLKTYDGPNGKTCKECGTDCEECIDSNVCTKCEAPKVLQGAICKHKCDPGFVAIDGKCKKCNDDAKCHRCDVDDLDVCNICKEEFVLKDGKCETDCGPEHFVSDEGDLGDVCKDCKEKCESCKNKESCDKCVDPFVLHNNNCIDECPSGFISIERVCKKCSSERCHKCCAKNLGKCQECKDTFFLKDGKCVTDCGIKLFENEEVKECESCNDKNCDVCTNDTDCERCDPEFNLLKDKCYEECPTNHVADADKNCKKCTQEKCHRCDPLNTDICKDCNLGFLFEGVCKDKCPKEYFGKNKKCKECKSFCEECTDSTDCQKCVAPYLLNKGSCDTECDSGFTPVDGICKKCEENNCNNCDTDINTCDECTTPFKLHEGKCLGDCPDGYYADNGKCKPCEENCTLCKNATDCLACDPEKAVLHKEDCIPSCPKFTFKNEELNKCKCCGEKKKCEICKAEDPEVCEECTTGFFLHEGKCLEECPEKFFENNKTKKCCECIDDCVLCNNKETCEKCESPTVLHGEVCIEKCPEGWIPIDGKCEECTGANCKTCKKSDLDKCDTCKEGTKFYENNCLEECPKESTFQTVVNEVDKCKDCHSTCLTCESFPECKTCKNPLSLHEGECKENCPDSFVTIANVCHPCSDSSCKKCDASKLDKCLECTEGTFLAGDKCVERCPKGTFPDTESKTCKDCKSNCDECSTDTDCVTCKEGFFFVEGTDDCDTCSDKQVIIGDTCYDCKAAHCDKCTSDSDSTCEDCAGHYVLIDGTCHDKCPKKTFKVGQDCVDCIEDCYCCDNDETCNKCVGDKVKHLGKCIDKCPIGWVKNDSDECIKCNQDTCEVCNPEKTGECYDCDSNSHLNVDGTCVEDCPEGTHAMDGKCHHCSDNCKSCDKDECKVCEDGFFLKDGECTNNCGSGFYPDKDSKTCKECTDENCDACNKDECTECNDPYLVSKDGTCVLTCSDGYYKDENKCAPCKKGCKTCSDKDTCESCDDNLNLHDADCIPKCPNGMTPVDFVCTDCTDEDCKKCESDNIDTCVECEKGFLEDGDCVEKCPDGTFVNPDSTIKKCKDCDTTCKTCKDEDTCSSCEEGLILHEGECINECPDKTIHLDESCKPCGIENCNTCVTIGTSDKLKCVECIKPAILDDGKCVSECPDGKFHNEKKNKCDKCHLGCKTCEDCKTCETCKTGFFMDKETGLCVQHCPPETFGNCDSQECEECNPSCQICSGSTADDCLTCNINYIFQEKTCVPDTNCQEGFFPNHDTKKCEKCAHSNCIECSAADVCTKCKDQFALKDGVCAESKLTKSVLTGNLLQTPLSPTYLQTTNFSFADDLDGVAVGSNDFSVSFYLRALGVTRGLHVEESKIWSVNTVSTQFTLGFSITRSSTGNKCKVSVGLNGTTVGDLEIEGCDEDYLYNWRLFTVSLSPKTGDVFKLHLSVFNKEKESFVGKDKDVTLAGLKNLVEIDSNISLLNQEGVGLLGYQLSKFNVGDFVFSNEVLNNFTKNPPQKYTWICNTPSDCPSGFIPLLKGFQEAEAKYKLSDKVKTNNFLSTYLTYGAEFYVYYDSIEAADSFNVFEIFYPYSTFPVSKVTALKLTNSLTATNLSVEGNNIILPNTIKAKVWYIVKAGIKVEGNKVSYHANIKNAFGKEIVNEVIEKTEQINKTVKLYIDAELSFGDSAGQIYNPTVLINDLEGTEPKSVDDIKKTDDCEVFGHNFDCTKCTENFTLEEGKCIDDTLNLAEDLFHLSEIYSNKSSEYVIPSKFAGKDFTVVFHMRKLLHSIHQAKATSHRLVGFRNGVNVSPLITQLVQNDYMSKIALGDQDFEYSYKNSLFGYFQVFITYNAAKKSAGVFLYHKEQQFSAEVAVNGTFDSVILGDDFGREIQFEFKLGLIYPKALTEADIVEARKVVVKDTEAVCIDSDFKTGTCHGCASKQNSETKSCNSKLMGFNSSFLYGYSNFSNLGSKQSYVIAANGKGGVPHDLNSVKYGVVGFIRTITVHEYQTKGDAKFEIFNVRNNAHSKYFEQNPSNKLIALYLEVKEGKGQYHWEINTAGNGVVRIPLEQIPSEEGKWLLVIAEVDVAEKVFKYSFGDPTTKETILEDNHSYQSYPEKLQSHGELVLFGALSDQRQQLNVPQAEVNLFFLVLNMNSYDQTYGTFLTRLAPSATPEIENCLVPLHDSNSRTDFCVHCEESFILINYECQSLGLVAIKDKEDLEYQVLTDDLQTQNKSYNLPNYQINPDNKPDYAGQVAVSFFFRVNYTTKDSSHAYMMTLGQLKLAMTVENNSVYIKYEIGADSGVLGPLDTATLFGWHALYAYFELDKINIYLKRSGEISSIKDFANISETYFLPDSISIKSTNQFQIYGVHALNQNYGFPILPEPKRFDCGVECINCFNGICENGVYGVEDGHVKYTSVSHKNILTTSENTTEEVSLAPFFDTIDSLRSINFSASFNYSLNTEALKGTKAHEFYSIIRIKLSSTNGVELKVNRNTKNDFALTYSNPYTNIKKDSPPLKTFSLEREPTFNSIAIIIAVDGVKLNVIVFDSITNYKAVQISIEGHMDYLTKAANIKFGDEVEDIPASTDVATYKDISFSYDRALKFEDFISTCQEIKHSSQNSCSEVDPLNNSCEQCKDGFSSVTDRDGLKSCVSSEHKVFADNTTKVVYTTDSKPVSYEYNVSDIEQLNSFTFISNILVPFGHVNPIGLISIVSNGERIFELLVEGNDLKAHNKITGKSFAVNDALSNTNLSDYLTIAILIDLKSGYSKVSTYSKSSNSLLSGESQGEASDKTFDIFTINIGYVNESRGTETLFSFKTGAAYFYVNNKLTSQELTDISVTENNCGFCKVECESSGICPVGQEFTEIIRFAPTPEGSLLRPLDSIVEGFTSGSQFTKYIVKAKGNGKDYAKAKEISSANINVGFMFTNINKAEYQGLANTDLIPDNLYDGLSFSVYSDDSEMIYLNLFGGENGIRYELLPVGRKYSEFEVFYMEFMVDSEASTLAYSGQLDNLIFQFNIDLGNNDWSIEAINKDTLFFGFHGVEFAEIGLNVDLFNSFGVIHEIVEEEKNDFCGIDNCGLCRITTTGTECVECREGFNSAAVLGECTANVKSLETANTESTETTD